MKRRFAVLLVLCLVLCGCEVGGNTPTKPNTPGQSAEPTRPTDVEMVDYEARALTVKISINPEFALGLTRDNEIVSAEALNATRRNCWRAWTWWDSFMTWESNRFSRRQRIRAF